MERLGGHRISNGHWTRRGQSEDQTRRDLHILRHTYASALAMRGVPMGVIAAQLGHSDTRMTERHYADLSPNYVAETVRAALPALGIVEKSNVTALRNARG
jgi:integrase